MNLWIEQNIFLGLSFGLFLLGKKLLPAGDQRRWGLFLFVFSLALPILSHTWNDHFTEFTPAIVKKVEALPVKGIDFLENRYPKRTRQFEREITELPTFSLSWVLILGIALGLLRQAFSFLKLFKLRNKSLRLKSRGKLVVLTDESGQVPFSFRGLSRFYIFLPYQTYLDSKKRYIALLHEGTHHRLGDTTNVYLIELLKLFFFFNPFIYLWTKELHLWMEMRCDQKVLEKIEKKNYVQNIVDTLKDISKEAPTGVLAMASLTNITRRIDMMFLEKMSWRMRLKSWTLVAASALMLTQASFAMKSLLPTEGISFQKAKELATSMESEIPIDVNAEVMKYVDYYLTDPKGRIHLRRVLSNLKRYKKPMTKMLKRRNKPMDLMAVPLMESGYRNHARSPAGAAGLWQIMPATGRRLGLVVDEYEDERFNIWEATHAAIDYYERLMKIHTFEKDWRFVLLAYNTGEGRLKKAIAERKSMNPWDYSDLGDRDYLAKIMAAMIILRI
ncbi:MAG: M56 and MltD domain-containing protein [Halobacteriovoraceae bacterium]|nr:M56 and MltD domain-containing protein [Halobacteriovoraceae bacterium]